MKKALIIVDVQNDFLPGGALGVDGGYDVIPAIQDAVDHGGYDVIVTTQDWHPADHVSFVDPPEFRDGSWPAHCVQDTRGSKLHPAIAQIDAERFFKGEGKVEAYSGFDGHSLPVLGERTDLATYLRREGVERIDVVGLATDYCVRATALDGKDNGFDTRVLLAGVRGVAQETTDEALAAMEQAGVKLVRPCFNCGAVEQIRCCEFGAER